MTITTAEELDALPRMSIIIDEDGDAYQKFDEGWRATYSANESLTPADLPERLTLVHRPDQPTEAQVKAKAWHEGLHAGYAYISRCEDAEAAGQGFIVPDPVNPYRLAPAQPTPVFEAMGLETPEVPNVGGEGR